MTFAQKFKKRLKKTSPVRIIVFLLFAIWGVSYVFGLVWAFVCSLNSHDALMRNSFSLPKVWNFKNYILAFEAMSVGGATLGAMLFNSLWFAVGTTFIYTAVSVMAGYALGNFKFHGRNFFVALIVVIMMIPIYGAGSSILVTYIALGMYDSPLLLISSATMMTSNTLIIMTFFQTLPKAYEEAAQMDGAGYMCVFLKIHFPMVLPGVGALALLSLISGWNNVDTPLYYLPSYPTLATGLYKYEAISEYTMNKPVYFAGVIMCAIPPIILFSIFREKLMTGVTIGGIK